MFLNDFFFLILKKKGKIFSKVEIHAYEIKGTISQPIIPNIL